MNTKAFVSAKRRGKKWVVLTAYDAPTARILDESGVDWILVGDSVGMVLLGYGSTTPVSMDEMIHHAKAVRRGAPETFTIGDLPLEAVNRGPERALAAAKRFMKEGGCDAVKIEWRKDAPEITRRLRQAGIPVMGHVGLTPQQAKTRDGYRVQGKLAGEAIRVMRRARTFESLGAFAVVIECVPGPVAEAITKTLKIPTIGIGAGRGCDGQVLVFHDLVGLFTQFQPRHVRRYASLADPIERAVKAFVRDSRRGKFPRRENTFPMERAERLKFAAALGHEQKGER